MVDFINTTGGSVPSARDSLNAALKQRLQEAISQAVILARAGRGQALVYYMSQANDSMLYYNRLLRTRRPSLLGRFLNIRI